MHKKFISLFIKDEDSENLEEVRYSYGRFSTMVGIVSNFSLFVIKFILGTLTFSVALKADAINNLFDSLSSVVALFGFKMAIKPADAEHPYGHGRFETISDLLVGIIIVFFGFEFVSTSYSKIISQESILYSPIIVYSLIFTILVKLWQSSFNKYTGNKINSKLLLTTAQDSMNDVLVTSAILIGIVVEQVYGLKVDGYLGILLSLFIIYSGLQSIFITVSELLGERIDDEQLQEIESLLLSYNETLGYHDLIVHSYGNNRIFASVHIEVDSRLSVLEVHDIADMIEQDFLDKLNINLVIHQDPVILDDPVIMSYFLSVKEIIYNYDNEYSMHEFRYIKHKSQNIISFELVVCDDEKRSDEMITNDISALIHEKYNEEKVRIMIDRNYLGMR